MIIKLEGKIAIVTGSTAGIGHAIAAGLAEAGATVVVNGRTEERVQQAIAQIKAKLPKAQLKGLAADLGTAEGAKALIASVPEADILVNNLGIFEPKPFFEIPDEDWERFFRVNVLSGARLARHYTPGMVARKWGRVMFISSESGLQIPAEMVHYGMTKTAQLAVARGLAETVAGTGVTVNSVLPGPTRSEGVEKFVEQVGKQSGKSFEQMEKDFFRSMRPSSLIKRFATNEEVANMVVYLASEQASATTGAAVRVDGGVVRSIA
ncbi:MAG TPA: SDR family oxidoreductase [Candidatus Angelobacter sp.]|jgi:NAD(P)-dependent dehydrogenase (short-subunit alcohol dehydrogenase family)